MIPTLYNSKIPEWVKPYMKTQCDYCHSLLIDNEEFTDRRCANPKCPGHMAYKIAETAKYFKVAGVGAKTALAYLNTHNCTNHLDILKTWFNSKPRVTLSTVATLAQINGYGEITATKELSSYKSFEDYFTNCRNVNPLLAKYRDYLFECEKYFEVLPPLSRNQMIVMGTGAFHGYANREDYFELINKAFGQYVHVIQAGPRKTGVSYLLKETDAVDHRKSAIARECGIPIITPSEFVQLLMDTYHIYLQ